MATRTFARVLIANRGEIAARIARGLWAMGIEPVAVFSDADRDAPHVRLCRRAVRLGPPEASQSYLRVDAVIEAARASGAEAIHPGYGFLSERPALAEACAQAGLVLIGPSAHAMRVMGDKASARRAMQRAGVPVIPGSDGALDEAEARAWARRVGYPVLLKASAGGGGKGMRLVHDDTALPGALQAAQSEAQKAFGDGTVYLEKALQTPRHIEVQIVGDTYGEVIALGERECSMQRRHQKVIEEAPSAAIDADTRARMQQVACRAAQAVDYVGAGTVEFLLDASGQFFFLEMNTRLQVEHAVTEEVYGVDLVAAQVRIAQGEPMPILPTQRVPRGHAIEARLYAEDARRGFLPSPGVARVVHWPMGPGIRVDAGIDSGSHVTGHYDPMVAKIIATAPTRTQARQRLVQALRETRIEGLVTNRDFLLAALQSEAFDLGDYHTGSLAELALPPMAPAGTARTAALVALLLARHRADGQAAAPPPVATAPYHAWRQAGFVAQGL